MQLFQFLIDLLREVWPFRSVAGWERGVMTVFQRPWRDLGPGIYPVIPYVMDVVSTSTVPAIVTTPLLNVVLSDGRRLSFSASAVVQVVDVRRAIFAIDDHRETALEDIASLLADQLADVDPERFQTPRKRRNLMKELVQTLNESTQPYGVTVQEIRFQNWILDIRTYRVLTDSATSGSTNW